MAVASGWLLRVKPNPGISASPAPSRASAEKWDRALWPASLWLMPGAGRLKHGTSWPRAWTLWMNAAGTGLSKEAPPTFAGIAARYIQEMSPGWRDPRSASVWTSSLERLAYPQLATKQVTDIGTDDVLNVLRPIWENKTETADRLRGRIERILDYATTHDWREGENPARWRGHLANILPKPSSVAKVRHHPAIPRKDIAHVMAKLAAADGMAAKAVRFTCMTAGRSGEIRNAVWSEIDLATRIWTVPASRMKTGKEHRVPLSEGAMAVLQEVLPLRDKPAGDLVFPGGRIGRPLSDVALSKALHMAAGTKEVTVHGLRSTFRDWAAEETDYPREVAEMALAHAISDKVEAAYRRGDLFDKRREMMTEWYRNVIGCFLTSHAECTISKVSGEVRTATSRTNLLYADG